MKKGIVFSILLIFFFNSYAEENTLQREYFILNPKDTKIYAIEDGKVLTYGFDFKYGNYIEIEYFTIGLKVKYCNLGQIKYFLIKQ